MLDFIGSSLCRQSLFVVMHPLPFAATPIA
jgi:hypothetical protein